MGAFVAYSKTEDVLMDESDSEQVDFDIGSDAFNTDLLKLKQNLNKIGPEKAQRDLADATQEITF